MNRVNIILMTGICLLLICGTGSAALNLTGQWVNTKDPTLSLIGRDDPTKIIWYQETSSGPSESDLSITPIVDTYFLVQSPEKGFFFGVLYPESQVSLYNVSIASLSKDPLTLPVFQFNKSEEQNSSDSKGLFLSGFSTGVDAYQDKQTGADTAGVEGNERFDEKSSVECDSKMCTCDGELCSCTGKDCQCEGGDCQKKDTGYGCKGWDCWFICNAGEDCKISG